MFVDVVGEKQHLVVEAQSTDDVRALGLIKAATEPPTDATDTERLMAAAGRTIER